MIDKKWIGHVFPPITTKVEAGQLGFFAKATTEKNPIYTDKTVAKENGYADLPAPPTFGFSLTLATPNPFKYMMDMGVPLGRVLHGEQQFKYIKPIMAGDEITLQRSITDILVKKGGKMELVVEEITLTNQANELVGKMTGTIVVMN
jgi:acyl dehydratase